MNIFVETDYASINKQNEELCGDKVEIIRDKNSTIIVLADGLGSGVKANILATLTSKIIGTMLSEGASIDEAVETITNTLPLNKERGLAYSTFSILQVLNSGDSYLVQFDNPSAIRLIRGKYESIICSKREINGKIIGESRFKLSPNEIIIMTSDGVVNAGVGHSLKLGWQWKNVEEYVEKVYKKEISAKNMSMLLISACNNLYENEPGDDATVVTIKIRKSQQVNVMIGPPIDKNIDSYVVNKFINQEGKKIVCGGTTSQIVCRELGKKMVTNLNYIDSKVPPTAEIEGIDLTSEGILTMGAVLNYAQNYSNPESTIDSLNQLNKNDGASKLAKLLLEESTSIHFFVGRALNPAHQNPDFPLSLGMKLNMVSFLSKILKKIGKEVVVEYY